MSSLLKAAKSKPSLQWRVASGATRESLGTAMKTQYSQKLKKKKKKKKTHK